MGYKQVFFELSFRDNEQDLSVALNRVVKEQKVYYKTVEVTHLILHRSQRYTLALKVAAGYYIDYI